MLGVVPAGIYDCAGSYCQPLLGLYRPSFFIGLYYSGVLTGVSCSRFTVCLCLRWTPLASDVCDFASNAQCVSDANYSAVVIPASPRGCPRPNDADFGVIGAVTCLASTSATTDIASGAMSTAPNPWFRLRVALGPKHDADTKRHLPSLHSQHSLDT